MKVKTVLTWAAVAFAIWWIVQSPHGASHLVGNVGHVLTSAADGISHFITTI